MVFGTFDVVHKGHINFFKQARKLSKNPFLIVSLARDVNVKRIKGNKPVNSEKTRLRAVKSLSIVDRAVLGDLKNHFKHILKEKPEIIALGYDQNNYVENLERDLAKNGLDVRVVRLKPFKSHIYKTSKMVQNERKE
jgi:FAD synthetase